MVKVLGGLDEPVAEQEAVLLAAGVRTQDWTPQQLAELPPVNYQPTLQEVIDVVIFACAPS